MNYNLPNGWYLGSAPVITANWNASHQDMWTVPVGGYAGKIVKLGGKLQAVGTVGDLTITYPGNIVWFSQCLLSLLYTRREFTAGRVPPRTP